MQLIDRDAAIEAIRDLQLDPSTTHYIYSSDAIDAVRKQPTIEAVPIKAISAWLAAYAAPPLYASDHVAAIKNKVLIITETERAKAWEYHWKHLMECGLLQEEYDAPDRR